MFLLNGLPITLNFVIIVLLASVAQLVEQWFCKPLVTGSNPVAGSSLRQGFDWLKL